MPAWGFPHAAVVFALLACAHAKEETRVYTVTTPGSGTYTVPDDIFVMKILAEGAGGGGGWYISGTSGALVEVELLVTPGDVITMIVGQGGSANGSPFGGGGGGGTSVSLNGDVVAIAGGGGGSADSMGGDGGGLTGVSGLPWSSTPGGNGGTQTGPGSGGNSGSGRNGGPGTSSCGNSGATGDGTGGCGGNDWSAGGGGGYFGGGGGRSSGGYGSGGGGGSSFASSSATDFSFIVGGARRAVAGGFLSGPDGLVELYSVVVCPEGQATTGSGGACQACAAGSYRRASDDASQCVPCVAGVYGAGGASACTTQCPMGSYCPAGSGTPTLCPAGTYGDAAGAGSLSQCKTSPAGYFTVAGTAGFPTTKCEAGRYGTEGQTASTCTGLCWAGYFCLEGSTAPNANVCPAGRFGAAGSSSATCDGGCAAGYSCPPGSTSATHAACGGAHVYCPAGGASNPVAVTAGYLSTPSTGALNTRTGQSACPAGSYCHNGVTYTCPAGRYGSDGTLAGNPSLPLEACTGPCGAGYYCDAGSTTATQHECGSHPSCAASPASCFCPEGSSAPSVAAPGTYTTPLDAPEGRRTGSSPCPDGFTCADGVRQVDANWDDCAGGVTQREVAEQVSGAFGDPVTGQIQSSTPTYSVGQPTPAAGCAWVSPPAVTVDASGQLSVSGTPLDYETCTAFAVDVTASAFDESIVCAVEVSVTNVNERPSLTGCDAGWSVSESAEPTTRILPNVGSTDPDGDAVLYTVTGGSGQSLFALSSCGGIISIGDSRVVNGVYTLEVMVEDDNPSPLTDTCTITVTVLDANDAPTLDPATASVAEDASIGDAVVALVAADADGDALTFSISRPDIPNAFTVDASGVLRLVATVDHEAKPLHSLRVSVTDGIETAEADVLVTVTDVAEPPVLGPLFDTLSFAEFATVGTLATGPAIPLSDPDDAALAGSYTLTMADSAGGLVGVDSATRRLRLDASGLNYETAPVLSVEVRVEDPSGLTATLPIQVAVTDVNEAPWVAAGQTRSVAEVTTAAGGSSRGAAVGAPLTGDDFEDGAQLTWSIEAGNLLAAGGAASGPAFAVSPFTGQLSVAGDLDFETTPAYNLTVQVRDSGGLLASQLVAVVVGDVNEAPTLHVTRITVPENSAGGIPAVATLEAGATTAATDPDADDDLVYAITGGASAALFDIAPATGAVTVAAACTTASPPCFNFESPEEAALEVTATDGGGLVATALVDVRVSDVNEAPTVAGRYVVSVPSGLLTGAVVTTVRGNDEDGDELTFALGAAPPPEAAMFTVQPQGSIVVADSAALAAAASDGGSSFSLPITVADPAGLTNSGAVEVTILSTDLGRPVVAATFAFAVDENSDPGVVVGYVTADLPSSAAPEDDLVFALGASTPASAADLFRLDTVDTEGTSPGRGLLQVRSSSHAFGLDAEWQASVDLTVSVSLGTAVSYTSVTVTLNDLNEAPTLASPATLSVSEAAPPGTPTSTTNFTAVDQDAGDAPTVSVVAVDGDPAVPFTVSGPPSGFVLVTTGALDFEAAPSYRVVVSVTDGAGAAAEPQTLTVTVVDVNEAPAVSPLAFSVAEDTAVGAAKAAWALAATDPEANQLSFSISGGNTNTAWAVATRSGSVSLAAPLDFEDMASYTLDVEVSDGTHVVPTTVTITVTDVDDLTVGTVEPEVVPTTGGTITVTGTNIGRTDGANGGQVPAVTLIRGLTSVPLTGCTVTPNTAVTCTVPAGVGQSWSVSLSWGGQAGFTANTLAYARPSINTVSGGALNPDGGDVVTLTGSGFGPAGTPVDAAVYGRTVQYGAACTVVDDATATCVTAAGVGTHHEWQVSIAGQVCDPIWSGVAVSSSYAPPAVTRVESSPLETPGGTAFVVHGTGFPPVDDGSHTLAQRTAHAVAVHYGAYSGVDCRLQAAGEVACQAAPGFGANLGVTITVGDQTSPALPVANVSYAPPVVQGVRGAGAREASTSGGQAIVIDGTGFGPAGTPVGAVYGDAGDGLVLAAVDCEVPAAAPHTQVRCLTAQGTGVGHSWQVTAGGQQSGVVLPVVGGLSGTGYAAPVITRFEGAGSADALTSGGQTITIHGDNFGFQSDKLGAVTYSEPATDGEAPQHTFNATGCLVTVPHMTLTCTTTPGAGENLEWQVVVDGQQSRQPVTYYELPAVTGIQLQAAGSATLRPATDADMDGSDTLVIDGTGFGPSTVFLDAVTYGPSSVEYAARDCVVTVPHTRIACGMVPGFGSGLGVRVVVAAQENADPDAATLSFEAVAVSNMSVATGPTDVAASVVLTGRFGALDPQATVAVVYGANDGSAAVLSAAVSPQPGDSVATGAAHSLQFELPEEALAGARRGVWVRVSHASGVSFSSPVSVFEFHDADVLYVTVRDGATPHPDGAYELTMYGESLGLDGTVQLLEHDSLGVPPAGAVFTALPPAAVTLWTHTSVTVRSNTLWGQLRVVSSSIDEVGASRVRTSTVGTFASVSPSLSQRSGLPPIPEFATSGYVGAVDGTDDWLATVLEVPLRAMQGAAEVNITVGGTDCPLVDAVDTLEPSYCPGGEDATGGCIITLDTEWLVRCYMPPGDDQQLGVPVTVTRNGQPGDPFNVFYRRAEIEGVEVDGVAVAVGGTVVVPTTGAPITITGLNFGTAPVVEVGPHRVYAPGSAPTPTSAVFTENTHSRLQFVVPAGEGSGSGAFRLTTVSGRSAVNEVAFSYAPPAVSSVTVAGGHPTSGGNVVTVEGTSLGLGGLRVHIGGSPCEPVVPVVPHFTMECVLPEGAGANLDITFDVADLSSSLPASFSYDPPVVVSATAGTVTAPSGGVLELASGGGVPVTLAVANGGSAAAGHAMCVFVSWASVDERLGEVRACDGVERFHGEGEVPAVDVTSHTHTEITFVLPRGVGLRHVVVMAEGQSSYGSADPVTITSPTPAVSYITPNHGSTNGATEVNVLGSGFGVGPAGGVAAVDALPGAGWPLVDATGSASLPPWPPSYALHVTFHTRCVAASADAPPECARTVTPVSTARTAPPAVDALVAHGPTVVTFHTLGGIGVNRTVSVVLTDTRSGHVLQSSAALFTYDAPEVSYMQPMPASPIGGGVMAVYGDNFGRAEDVETEAEAVVALAVNDVACESAQRVDRLGESTIECTDIGVHRVGFLNVSLTIAGQSTTLPPFDTRAVAVCPAGSFGQMGERCLPCPQAEYDGATCPGDVALYDDRMQAEPVANAGWYNLNTTSCEEAYAGDPAAYALRSHRAACNYVLPCEPAEACLGNNECAVGYASSAPVYRCADCAEGYYRRAGFCEECPDNAWLIFLCFFLVAIAACVTGYILNSKNINVAFVSIGVDYFQVLAMFANSRIAWPGFLMDLWHILSAFNFSLDISAPECTFESFDFKTKFLAIQALPLAAGSLLVFLHLAGVVLKLIKGRRRRLHKHASVLISSFLILMYFLYLQLVRSVTQVFDCTPTEPDDGKTYLEVVFEECGLPGGIQLTLLPYAIVALCVYVIGYPALMSYILVKHRQRMQEDQLLRAHGVGDDRASNPRAYDVRKRYQRLYYLFTPDRWYWILCILLRKAAIAFTALLLNKNSAMQMAVTCLILILAYASQVHARPFMSIADRRYVIQHHHMESFTPGSKHARLRENVKAALAHARKAGHMNALERRRVPASDMAAQAVAALSDWVRWCTNYNTVESVLLFSAVMICLSAVMLESGQFDTQPAQKDTVAAIIIFIVFATIVYWVAVFVHEVVTLLRSSKVDVKATKKGRKKPGGASSLSTKSLESMETGADGSQIQTAMNPMFTRAGGVGGAAAPAPPTDAKAKVSALAAALSSSEAPTGEEWELFKSAFADVNQQLQDAIAARQAEARARSSSLSRGSSFRGNRRVALRTKRVFKPTETGQS